MVLCRSGAADNEALATDVDKGDPSMQETVLRSCVAMPGRGKSRQVAKKGYTTHRITVNANAGK
jgi:hypothetical protein